jgi:GTPase Era involved in 16S rRNA processing
MALRSLTETKEELMAALTALADLGVRAGTPSLAERIHADRLPRLAEERALLVVLGEFSRGKTTLVNALLGEAVLPMGVTPTTALIHEIRYGEERRAVLVRGGDGEPQREPVALERLAELTVGAAPGAVDLLRVEIELPAPLLRDRVTLVDTPGVNDLNLQRAEITYGYVPRADAVLFVLDATQALTESEARFLAERLLAAGRDRIVFALNKADLLGEDEQAQVLTFVREQLVRLLPGAPVVLTSATRALGGQWVGSGVDELEARLGATLGGERLRLVLDVAADEAMRLCDLCRQALAVRRRGLGMDAEELGRRAAALQADVEQARQRVEERRLRITEEVAAVRQSAHEDLREFTAALAAALPREIEKVAAADVRTYLGDFVEDAWRDWLATEARTLGGRLEALADSIVAIVNDDAREADRALREFVREGAGGLDLRVDTSAYDVSVVAVGAVGMGVMIFSSLLLGGLLTLAAPLLATFFRWRVDEEVKRKAADVGPAAVRACAARVAPELDRVILDFGRRLDEFVTAATGEVRRTLLEALAATRRALDEAHEGAAPAAATIDAQIAEADRLRAALAALRAKAWDRAGPSTD